MFVSRLVNIERILGSAKFAASQAKVSRCGDVFHFYVVPRV